MNYSSVSAFFFFCLFYQHNELQQRALLFIIEFQRKLNGYKFPVYTTDSCPRNETEWRRRESAFNCKANSSYACFPNDQITELLEFCYPLPLILIHKGKIVIETKANYVLSFYQFVNVSLWIFRFPFKGLLFKNEIPEQINSKRLLNQTWLRQF